MATILLPAVGFAQSPNIKQFRFLSTIIRDRLPTVGEAKDFYNGNKSLDAFITEWLASTDHRTRVERYFNDMFGSQQFVFISQEIFDLIPSSYDDSIDITSSDTHIDFTDDDGLHSASISTANYAAPGDLATDLEAAMDAAATDDYTVSYNSSTEVFTISTNSTSLIIHWNTGANATNTIGDKLGFSVSSDATGSTSYSGSSTATTSNNIPSDLKQSGVYYLPNYTKATCDGTSTVDAWWTDSQVTVCNSATSPAGTDLSFIEIRPDDHWLDFTDDQGSHSVSFAPVSIAAADQWIDFTDDDGAHSASISATTYGDYKEIAAALETAMNGAAGVVLNYTVTFDSTARTFSIANDGSVLTLSWNSGANTTNTIGDFLGFDTAADASGDTTYTGQQITTYVPYFDYAQLASDMQTAINSAPGVVLNYTVSYNPTTNIWTIANDGSTLELNFVTGPHAGDSIGDRLAFWEGTDWTGQTSYDGGNWFSPNIRCSGIDGDGIMHPDCGCGKDLVFCYPQENKGLVMAAVTSEFKNRAFHFYDQGESWLNVFGGSRFYGNRYLYHHYLYQQDIVFSARNPPQAVFDDMYALDPTQMSETAMPDHSYDGSVSGADGPQRAGVVTSPAFLRRFNNFRSRIRAITERMLCKDVDASLNIDNYQTFNNPNFTQGSDVYEHGTKEGCATCHYSLDNFAATIIGWGDGSEGFWSSWYWPQRNNMHLGHVFGVDGNGPRFLIDRYVNTPESGFVECMAKRAFEDFTGGNWNNLASEVRADFVAAAKNGPRDTIRTILSSKAVKDLRVNKPKTVSSTVTITYDYADDINPILEAKCAPCHAEGGGQTRYVDHESNFKTAPTNRLTDGTMPPGGANPLTQDEIDRMLIWINQ